MSMLVKLKTKSNRRWQRLLRKSPDKEEVTEETILIVLKVYEDTRADTRVVQGLGLYVSAICQKGQWRGRSSRPSCQLKQAEIRMGIQLLCRTCGM